MNMELAIADAEAQLRRSDMVASKLARLLRGRLRKCDSSIVLSELKRELRDYNAHTGQWKEKA